MRQVWAVLVAALGVASTCAATPIRSVGCAPTAEAAVTRMLARVDGGESPEGYRVASIRVDRIRGQRWALVASCAAPSAPMRAIALPKDAVVVLDGTIGRVVKIGDRVTVVKQTADSSMELTGVAEAGGEKGESIRVRLPKLSDDTNDAAPEIQCRILGQGVVEALR